MTFTAHYLQHGGVLGLCHAAFTQVYTNGNKLDMQCMPVHSKVYSAAYVYVVTEPVFAHGSSDHFMYISLLDM